MLSCSLAVDLVCYLFFRYSPSRLHVFLDCWLVSVSTPSFLSLSSFLSSPRSCPTAPIVAREGRWHETGNAKLALSCFKGSLHLIEKNQTHIRNVWKSQPVQNRLKPASFAQVWMCWYHIWLVGNVKQNETGAQDNRYFYFLSPEWSNVLWRMQSACKQTCYSWALGLLHWFIRCCNTPHPHTQTVSLILLFSASFKHNYLPATDWFPAQVKSRCQATYKHSNKFLGHTIMVVVFLRYRIECVRPVLSLIGFTQSQGNICLLTERALCQVQPLVCVHTHSNASNTLRHDQRRVFYWKSWEVGPQNLC